MTATPQPTPPPRDWRDDCADVQLVAKTIMAVVGAIGAMITAALWLCWLAGAAF